MAKILTDKELGEIIWKATHDESLIDCADSYTHFLEDLAELVCNHFGGDPEKVAEPEDGNWTIAVHVDECVPADGGIFKDYSTDVQWIDGKEIKLSCKCK